MGRKRKPQNNASRAYAAHLNVSNDGVDEATIRNMLARKLTEMCATRFEWVGLPDGIDERFLEMTLFNTGLAVFTKTNHLGKFPDENDLVEGFVALRGTPSSANDYQGNPTRFAVYGNQMFNGTRSVDECVPIWSNYARQPDLDIVSVYAHRLAHLDRTIEINSANARMPRILVTTDNTRLSVENFNRQIEQGVPSITIDPMLADVASAIDMGVDPNTIEKLHIVRQRLWNECMGLLGIEHANQDKRERLVAAEVGANNEQTSVIRRTNLAAREQACAAIREKFGIDVSVRYHTVAPIDSEDETHVGYNPQTL